MPATGYPLTGDDLADLIAELKTVRVDVEREIERLLSERERRHELEDSLQVERSTTPDYLITVARQRLERLGRLIEHVEAEDDRRVDELLSAEPGNWRQSIEFRSVAHVSVEPGDVERIVGRDLQQVRLTLADGGPPAHTLLRSEDARELAERLDRCAAIAAEIAGESA